jgi:hypothetical protein
MVFPSNLEAEAREIKARFNHAFECYLEHIKEDVARKSREDFTALIQSFERANLPRLTFPSPTIIEEEVEAMHVVEDQQMVMTSEQEKEKEESTMEIDPQQVCVGISAERQELLRRMDAQDERMDRMSEQVACFKESQKQILEMLGKLSK